MTSSFSLLIASTLVATATAHIFPFRRFPYFPMHPMPMMPMMNPMAQLIPYRGMMAPMGGAMAATPGMMNPGVMAVPSTLGTAAMGNMGGAVMGGMAMGGAGATTVIAADPSDINVAMPAGSLMGSNGQRVLVVGDTPDNVIVG